MKYFSTPPYNGLPEYGSKDQERPLWDLYSIPTPEANRNAQQMAFSSCKKKSLCS